MSALAEVERLEAIDADVGLGENGKANLERARRALESQKRQERRDRAAARQQLTESLAQHQACLTAHYDAVQTVVNSRRNLDKARREAQAAERVARAADVLDGTHGAAEIAFFDRKAWRALHDEARQLIGRSLV